jgi:hypothetical protein
MTECLAGCGVELHPAAAEGGFTVHPGCEPTELATECRWGCGVCLDTGTADNAAHAVALERAHRGFVCPGSATSPTDPAARPEHVRKDHSFRDSDGFDARIGRRAALTRLYPDEVPPYDKPFR